MPQAVQKILKKNRIKESQVGIVVRRLDSNVSLIEHRGEQAFNPASVTKLLTSIFALEKLGPAYRWTTTLATNGSIANGVLKGDLYLVGGGDPYITHERFLLMLNYLRDIGIARIEGDLVIDHSRYELPPHDQGGFDGVPTKPYNVGASAMAVNFKTHAVVFRPTKSGVQVFTEPRNNNFVINNKVKLVGGKCRNWRSRIRERLHGDELRMTLVLSGKYARRCKEQAFRLSVLSHTAYISGAFAAIWKRLGGQWNGTGREGVASPQLTILKKFNSLPLGSVMLAMNKYSNNVIARHLFIEAGAPSPPFSYAASDDALQKWLWERGVQSVVVENGSGLSRIGRISPNGMASVLDYVWRHPYRFEFISSLPILAVDGTMKKRLRTRKDKALAGMGHFKTGSLSGVNTISGYMQDAQGRALLVVIFTQKTSRGKRLQDDIIRWAYHLE